MIPLTRPTPAIAIVTLALSLLVAATIPAEAKDKESPEKKLAVPPSSSATEAAKRHLKQFLGGDFDKLEKSYADTVTLVAGHEFLKPEYQLAPDGERNRSAKVERSKLMQTIQKNPKKLPAERIEKLLAAMNFETLKAAPGEFATDPPDPVDTPDGKIRFQIKPGDQLIKVVPKKGGDFLLFQFMPVDKEWQVVAEYLD